MRKNRQLISSGTNGDCLRACITSLLGIPNSNDLPNTGTNEGLVAWYQLLLDAGIDMQFRFEDCWQTGYWIASVKSKNYEGGFHAIVMDGAKVYHDPSPKRRYHAGYSLSGKDIVRGGYIMVVTDFTKLKVNFQIGSTI